jgi:CRISPR-associated endonuclease/helicase Cas3
MYDASSGNWHPLVAHALETAAVGRVLIERSLPPQFIQFFARHLQMEENAAASLIVFLAGGHDIGKVNPGFQGQIEWFRSRLLPNGFPTSERIVSVPHGLITAHTLQQWFEVNKALPRVARSLASVVGGHHGVLPPPEKWRTFSAPELGGTAWGIARHAVLSVILEIFGSLTIPSRLPHASALILAGLVCVSDWIASNSDVFPYSTNIASVLELPDPREYYSGALRRAEKAIERLGWHTRRCVQVPESFAELFPLIETPHPLQQTAFGLANESVGPSLVLIEAAMGEGKTEAALSASELWASTLGHRGSYFALPTQATSDQMFSRVRAFLENRAEGGRLALQLLHGHASLSAEFEELRVRGTRLFEPLHIGASDPETVFASTWFTYRKRGLLASFGVGTVDQVLMAAFAGRHVFVRLFGLAGKTVIIDEVHAYDTYMSTLLERLLEWLGAIESSVVLLSATLPYDRRVDLLKAYARGLQLVAPSQPVSTSYPRITVLSRAGVRSVTFRSASPQTGKPIGLMRIQADRLNAILLDRLVGGGCAVVVCNTRRDAQRLFLQLEPHFPGQASDGEPELDLLHSHFLFAERDTAEKRCLRRFGKPRKGMQRPERAVLIATQVVEQSLDLDFDLMISALAPIDLLFQRIGRLHRHCRFRPVLLAEPLLVLIDTLLDECGLPKFPRGHTAVYEQHLLFRTWLALREREFLAIPDDIDTLLDSVYRDEPEPSSLSEAEQSLWRETKQKLDQHRVAERAIAQDRYLRSPGSSMAVWELAEPAYAPDDPEQSQFLAVTRLTEPSIRVVFLEQDSSGSDRANIPGLVESIPLDRTLSLEQVRRCLYRSVTISDRRVVEKLGAVPPPTAFRNSPLLSEHRLVLLGADSTAQIDNQIIRLHQRLGVVIENTP